MTDNLKELITAIKENNVISIVYDKGKEDYYRKIHPYYIFEHRGKVYLIGLTDGKADPATYNLAKIKEIQITSLKFSEPKKAVMEYLKGNEYFTGRIECIDINSKTTLDQVVATINAKSSTKIDMSKSSYPKLYKVFEYYEKSMKAQNLMDLTIDIAEEITYYILDIGRITELFNSSEKVVRLDSNFKNIFPEWDKQIKYQPDLMLYLGYPYIEFNGKYIPVLYYALTYDIGKNTIRLLNSSFEVNGRFLDEDLELTDDEKLNLLQELRKKVSNQQQETPIFEKLNVYFREMIEQDSLINKGVIFLNASNLYTKKLVKELNDFKKLRSSDINVPLKSLVETQDYSGQYTTNDPIYNVVDINDSQEEVIRNANRNLLLVQGPPGTGKTQTIINIIANEVIRGNKVLVASVNNKAVDNVVEKLKDTGIFSGILRLGNQGYRTVAKNEIIDVLNKEYKGISPNEIEKMKSESRGLYTQICSLRKTLEEIIELEALEVELNSALSVQENDLSNKGVRENEINKFIEYTKAENLTRCNQLVMALNKTSIYCEKVDEARTKWIWRLLTKFNFDYDLFWGKRIGKRLISMGMPINELSDCVYLEDINLNIARFISIAQYKIIILKLNQVIEKLRNLEKETICNQLTQVKKEKIVNDQLLLKAVHNNSMQKETRGKKESLLKYVNIDGMNTSNSYTNIYNDLLIMYPVIATTSYAIANSIPQNTVFDLAIIDESSQCNIASSLPVIRRARRLIVVGDDKQLNPVITVEENTDTRNLEFCELIESKEVYSFKDNSTFDLFNKIINTDKMFLLNEHYRCHPHIIDFSNQEFYEGLLNIKTENTEGEYFGISAINVKGRVFYEKGRSRSASNSSEADFVIEFLLNNFEAISNKTIGVITPFRRQKELLKRKISKVISNCNDERQKEFLEQITIGTVHVFQGDECDIILFSSVLAAGVNEGSIKWVNENTNLINVAVTRAKELFVIIGDLQFLKAYEGVLSKLVRYIETVGKKGQDIQTKNIFNIYKLAFADDYNKMLESPYLRSLLNKGEESIYELLKNIIYTDFKRYELGVKIRVADIININKQRISNEEFSYSLSAHFDFVIFDKSNNTRPILAIEFDGKYHRVDKKTIMNDSIKNNLCKIFGFPLERISSEDYLSKDLLKNMLAKYCI